MKAKKELSLKDFFESIVIAIILALLIKTFVFQFYYIPSGSMEPTLQINDKILVTKYSYKLSEPERGEIIVFKYPYDKKLSYIKRLIGLPGEKIEIKDSKLYINDALVEESYLPDGLLFEDFGPTNVPKDQYFMLGDNRNHSSDSRVWGFVDKDLIIGKARFTYWPLDRMGGVY
ncbi:signal peptidase I Serine peptidase. MEROPS family S26A [Desulfonispora thiosulfatigenes DSM 11270]|uniref:Signal peptidase I n=1 Tax=Desulfonispora thiosulfatigenes DSM 11270 TaxID=656914 RepID=A0A1W1VKG7_DESTI|nr:signal peptidase I [Desulfonispora thiosulfatigenes]SMB93842.1 signal peptidase I Serine peptidase. MEROPS family S26A [Desulfonispora thiosulfatigenes DSM 11270]